MLTDKTSKALTGISKATLHTGVRVKHLFRTMTHSPDLWEVAYAKIYANSGATTRGVEKNTLDGMCQARISNLIELLKTDRYQPKPVRRVYIPKADSKKRPLGIPSGDDKLVQEVARSLLELIYEPVFSTRSHGFRPKRSCHTALTDISHGGWKSTKWIVDMDISSFYDTIDHKRLIKFLEKKIDDRKFLRLIKQMLTAGYMDDWKFYGTFSGAPQGGIVSPILANIYLHELDQHVESKIAEFNCGKLRASNPMYTKVANAAGDTRKRIDKLRMRNAPAEQIEAEFIKYKTLYAEAKKFPSSDMNDPNFKRLHYVRYADDFVLGVVGSKLDAERIKADVEKFISEELNLKIAAEKSGIRHIERGFDYLGYHISADAECVKETKYKVKTKAKCGRNSYRKKRSVNGVIHLSIPKEKVWAFCKRKGYLKNGKPIHIRPRTHHSDYEIVEQYNAEMRGFANYYALARKRNLYILEWACFQSMLRTLAQKHQTTGTRIRRQMKLGDDHFLKYEADGKAKLLKVFKIKDRMEPSRSQRVDTQPVTGLFRGTAEITERMRANKCEYCAKTGGYFEVHHVRKLKDVKQRKNLSESEKLMLMRRRKTLVLCVECHKLLHTGRLQGWRKNMYAKMESVVQ